MTAPPVTPLTALGPRRLLILLVPALAALTLSCGEAGPCIVCPRVAGVYDVTGTRPISNCDFDVDVDLSGLLTVVQEESLIELVEVEIQGTLRDDGSAYFNRKEVATFGEESLLLTVHSVFEAGEGEVMNLRGSAMITFSGDGCTIRSSFSGPRI